MNHWIIAPVVLPALLAPVIAYVMRHDIVLARYAASAAGTVALAAISVGLDGAGVRWRHPCVLPWRLACALWHCAGAGPAFGDDGHAN